MKGDQQLCKTAVRSSKSPWLRTVKTCTPPSRCCWTSHGVSKATTRPGSSLCPRCSALWSVEGTARSRRCRREELSSCVTNLTSTSPGSSRGGRTSQPRPPCDFLGPWEERRQQRELKRVVRKTTLQLVPQEWNSQGDSERLLSPWKTYSLKGTDLENNILIQLFGNLRENSLMIRKTDVLW